MSIVIKLENVSKRFTLHHKKTRSFQDLFVNVFNRNRSSEDFWALKDVSFEIHRGETVGIIGRNGSGKSTILKLISRILEPTSGKISINGKVAALLELGTGFHPDLTGRENVFLNGAFLGFSKKDMIARYESIVEFSELDHFIDIPVRHYSSGMLVRLGFAIAISVEPDILIADEVLAVGDYAFQEKCRGVIEKLQKQNKTMIVVSHDLEALEDYCTRAIWLDSGRIREEGATKLVIINYKEHQMEQADSNDSKEQSLPGRKTEFANKHSVETPLITEDGKTASSDDGLEFIEVPETCTTPESSGVLEFSAMASPENKISSGKPTIYWQDRKNRVDSSPRNRRGSGEVLIERVQIMDFDGHEKRVFQPGEQMLVRLNYHSTCWAPWSVFSVTVHRDDGVYVCGNNTYADEINPTVGPGEGFVQLSYHNLPLCKGTYYISVGVWLKPDDPLWSSPADYHDKTYEFEVRSETIIHGLVKMPVSWFHSPTLLSSGENQNRSADKPENCGEGYRDES